jgi:phosphatidylinositol alpha-1,6-mannosyltransferase
MYDLVLTERFLPSVGGSINWLINSYARYAPGQVMFVAPQECDDNVSDRSLPFHVERIPMKMTDWDPMKPSSFFRYLKLIYYISQLCSKYPIRQIHCAKVLPEGLVAYFIALLRNVPYLLYAHGEEIQFGATSRKFRWLMPKIYNHADAIIANSKNTKSLLLSLGTRSPKIHVIHPGVDITRFHCNDVSHTTVRQRFNLTQNPILLTVGRLQRRKGHDMVIRALPAIKHIFPQIKYLIVGDGEELAYLRDLSTKGGVAESVMFTGPVSDEELPQYYAASDIFIMPNREIHGDIEGFGIVYLEAAAAGKPVIGGRSGGTDDAILDGITGLRVDGNSPCEIANAVIALLSDPVKMKTMGANGRHRMEREFTWESVVHQTQWLSTKISRTAGRA